MTKVKGMITSELQMIISDKMQTIGSNVGLLNERQVKLGGRMQEVERIVEGVRRQNNYKLSGSGNNLPKPQPSIFNNAQYNTPNFSLDLSSVQNKGMSRPVNQPSVFGSPTKTNYNSTKLVSHNILSNKINTDETCLSISNLELDSHRIVDTLVNNK